ncbi:hypothetical protein KOW79_022390 [Hemibagrus wyckioides]|uniref:Protein kinase domain-containing protein n=1 Tax=Hemibagrus wyckioides TaxID=337641 RepID=A0A9D3SCN9_9TELE|nr:hypothetical protein KOW79_022390 [Hemibagrus wyckioides]
MTSNMSVSGKQDLKKDERMMEGKRSDSPEPSCVSMKSDWSMDRPIFFRDRDSSTDVRPQKKKSNISRNQLDSIFKELEHKVITLIKNELKRFRKLLSPDYPACTEREVEDEEDLHSVREGALKITLHFLKNMKHTDLANTLQNKLPSVYQTKLKSNLRDKFKRINEGISQHGRSALLNEIYTELYITEGWSGDVNNEHEELKHDPPNEPIPELQPPGPEQLAELEALLSSRYQLGDLLGNGCFGFVFKAVRIADNKKVAVKVVKKSGFTTTMKMVKCFQLLMWCLDLNPETRPTFELLARHEWFTGGSSGQSPAQESSGH